MSPEPTISKTTFTFTVLHRSDEPFLMEDPLQEALNRSMYANAVGWTTDQVTVEVPDSQVSNELIELGNDGEFFDDDLERAAGEDLSERGGSNV